MLDPSAEAPRPREQDALILADALRPTTAAGEDRAVATLGWRAERHVFGKRGLMLLVARTDGATVAAAASVAVAAFLAVDATTPPIRTGIRGHNSRGWRARRPAAGNGNGTRGQRGGRTCSRSGGGRGGRGYRLGYLVLRVLTAITTASATATAARRTVIALSIIAAISAGGIPVGAVIVVQIGLDTGGRGSGRG